MSDDSDDDWELAAKALETLQVDDDVLEIAIGRAVKENANNAFDGLLDDDDDREMQREVKTDSQRKTTIKAATTSSASCAVEIFSKMLGNPTGTAPTSATRNKILVLLDMNGTLLCRSPVKIKGRAKTHDCKVLNNFCYIRNGAKELVSWLVTCPSVDLCFYTSMMKKSAGPLAEYVTGNEFENIHLFDQPFNKKDPDGDKAWSMMRDLPRLWSLEDTPAYNHSELTTIMIDDSYAKMREYPDNVLILPEYTEKVIEDGEINDEKVLRSAVKFMDELVEIWNSVSIGSGLGSSSKDIRDLIRAGRKKHIF